MQLSATNLTPERVDMQATSQGLLMVTKQLNERMRKAEEAERNGCGGQRARRGGRRRRVKRKEEEEEEKTNKRVAA